jgi:Protein  of unknown function (DUF3018)
MTVPNRVRVERRREKMRAMGLRPVQIWVPDTRAPGFAAEAERQCRLLSANRDMEIDAWLDANNEVLFAELDEAERAG